MVWSVSSAVRDLPRLREISSVLIRHGLGDVVRRAGVVPLLERAGQVLHWGEAGDIAHLEPQQRVRLAFEELGPTFVKLGQMLSTREDLLPPAWTTELAGLHSQVAPVPSTSSCRRLSRRSAALRSRCLATSNANPTRPPRSPRCTGPSFRTGRL